LGATISTERELKLGAPPGFRIPDLSDLAPGLVASPSESRRHTAVYWDTRDLRLMRWDCGLRHRDVDGWAVKLPAASRGPELVRRELHFEGAPGRPPAAALDLLLGMTRREPLAPIVELRTVRDEVRLLDGAGRTLVAVTNDLVAALEGGEVARRFREVEVEFAADCPREVVEAIEQRLSRAGTGPSHRVAKHVRALGLEAGIAPELALPELGPDAPVGAALGLALARSVVSLVRHDPGARLDEDPEDVHQMRVATRRLRSHLKSFAPLLAEGWAEALREELRWLGQELGRVRDADVLAQRLAASSRALAEAEARAAKDLLDHLAAARRDERARLLASLRSPRYLALVESLVEAARAPALRGDAAAPSRAALAPPLAACWKRLEKRVAKLPSEPADAELHAVRIRAKHLRYAA
jgi:inorganic triphosphatase YgiF